MSLRSFEDARGDTTLDCDVVVVGSGPGGAAISRVLAEAGAKVVMLEEGPSRPRFKPNHLHTARYHMQENGMMVARGSGIMPIAAGRGVGGGSLVNSAIAFRAPAEVLDSWKDLLDGDERFGRAALDPVYDELEAILGVGFSSEDVLGENNMILVRGAKALGYPGGVAPRNTPGCIGCALCNTGCPSGGKASVDRNLIPMAREHGALVQGDAKVHTILVEGDRAAGVQARIHDTDTLEVVGNLTVRAGKVVLAAGAVGTPRLLHWCGLAPRLGDRVGMGMHVHPGNAVVALCDHEVRMWKSATQGAYFEIPDHPGILPHTFNAPPGALLVLLSQIGADAKAMLKKLNHVCGAVVLISDHGEGTVRATADGRADLTYTFAEGDVDRIKVGMIAAARVLMAGGAKHVTGLVHGVGWHDSVEAFETALQPRILEDFGMYASHPMASCRMAADPARSVVGVDGQAHGLKDLYLADASVFPSSLGRNPQLTTMAVATVIGRRMVGAA